MLRLLCEHLPNDMNSICRKIRRSLGADCCSRCRVIYCGSSARCCMLDRLGRRSGAEFIGAWGTFPVMRRDLLVLWPS